MSTGTSMEGRGAGADGRSGLTAQWAPGWPGIAPRWTSSAKSGVGASLGSASRVWFTLGYGILNEIYYPDVDRACTRDAGLIVTDGRGFFSEEKRHTRHEIACVVPGVPAFRLVNTCVNGRYRIDKEVIADPWRHAVLQRCRFAALVGSRGDYRVHVLVAPHLGNRGSGNNAWVGHYKGVPMLFAERDGYGIALASSAPWRARSVGFVGVSDGWQDLFRHGRMEWSYARAENGNVALCGEVAIPEDGGFVLALGLGANQAEAGHRALSSLLAGFDAALESYVERWQEWQGGLLPLGTERTGGRDLYRVSTAVLATHEAQDFPGGAIASLSIPWGSSKGDEDLGGYHLVWPRDLVATAGGLLAAGARADAVRVLRFLEATQEADGHWPQNMWLDGTPYWNGVQMDEAAFPILLVDLARREGALGAGEPALFWPMARRAAGYICRNGPVTAQDRWEEDPGYSPFTLAVEIPALLVAAEMADRNGEGPLATYLRETADSWNDSVERWAYVEGGELARGAGARGYYLRVMPPDAEEGGEPATRRIPIKNCPSGDMEEPADHVVSPDALALVRFGLRAPDDPRVVDTLKVIDSLLRVETPTGPAWRRYNGDGYGEHDDGSPFDGSGVGRAWPLLTGERAHYELAAGRRAEAERLLGVLGDFANEGGLLPEQIWDAPDRPERLLFFGKPSHSAMPLVWAHAEYVKLLRSLRDGRVFDTPPQAVERYVRRRTRSTHRGWRFNHRLKSLSTGSTLRIEVLAAARIRWTRDGWSTCAEVETRDTGLGVHVADLPTVSLPAGAQVDFTFHWTSADHWEGRNFSVGVS
ncbi:MAG TPA: glucan 1,4-alpha-glucosidase [Anaeromyxobacteraceae bacterium]|nr:glucan 1,4-alpha-glucosidase [Anaeromyxobacteraceae bacterium]